MAFYLTSYFHGARGCNRFDTAKARDVAAELLLGCGWTRLDGETRHKHFGFTDMPH